MRNIVAVLMLCSPLWAANHYMTKSGAGSKTGADWANAWADCGTGAGQMNPNSQTRGDVYYVGQDGTGVISTCVLHTTESSTTTITVKAATVSDHGTATGWSNSLGVDVSGQVHWHDGFQVWNGYYIFDGNNGNSCGAPTGSSSSCGFAMDTPASCASGNTSIAIGPGGSTVNNVQISRVSLTACSGDVQTQGIYLQTTTTSSGNTFSYNYANGFQVFIFDHATSTTIDHNYSVNAFSSTNHHGNQFDFLDAEVNPVITYNSILNCAGTVCLGANDTGANCSQGLTGAKIYGNIFNATLTAGGAQAVGDGIIGSTSRCFMANSTITNNVFTGSTTGWVQGCVTAQATCASATGNMVEDNIVYNETCAIGSGIATNDYNSYLSCTDSAPTETHGQVQNFNPFINVAGNNFTLTAAPVSSCASSSAICGGLSQSSTYTVDLVGNAYGSNGQWERGAYAYSSSSVPAQVQGQGFTMSGATAN